MKVLLLSKAAMIQSLIFLGASKCVSILINMYVHTHTHTHTELIFQYGYSSIFNFFTGMYLLPFSFLFLTDFFGG